MRCLQRIWHPQAAGQAANSPVLRPWRRQLRAGVIAPQLALRSPGNGAPLSLCDVITFESDLPGVAAQEASHLPRVEQLVDRASRVLREVNDMLAADAATAPPRQQPGQGAQQGPLQQPKGESAGGSSGGSSVWTAAADVGAAAAAAGAAEPSSRAVFGSSVEASERQASLTRRALQKSLVGQQSPQTSPPSRMSLPIATEVANTSTSPSSSTSSSNSTATAPSVLGGTIGLGSSISASPSSGRTGSSRSTSKGVGGGGRGVGEGGGGGATASERPAWAQALFASPSPSTSSSPSPANKIPPTSASASPSLYPSPLPPAASSASTPSPRPPQPSSISSPSSSFSAPQPRGSSASPSSTPAPAPTPAPIPAPAPLPRRALPAWSPLAFAEADLSVPSELRLKSEESLFSERARAAVLPPLQSVLELTAAAQPPSRGPIREQQADIAEAAAGVAPDGSAVGGTEEAALGQRLQDGAGRLADGTRFEKLSGTDRGPDGYEKRWEVLRGITGDGRVQWEECWWEASSRYGLREMGAFKKGCSEGGGAWVEEWKEVMYPNAADLRLVIERTAHKWARDDASDEWEEKWGERYEEAGRVHKWADKWAKAGCNVWHERWGEDYDGNGASQKWTDKWAERLLPEGGQEQWGDKWTETFGHGRGTKHGEVWSSDSGGQRYNRWWNEEHFGDGRVRKWGNSTAGEHWDATEQGDTYYNPVPHFGFQHAVSHSPQLWAVPLPPPEEGDDEDGLGAGVDRL